MVKHKRREDLPVSTTGEVRSKYFSIDSYFKSPMMNKKPKLSAIDQQVDKAIELSLQQQQETKPSLDIELKKERCPLCQTFIFVESVSMEVHVNACLDSQQQEEEKENTPPEGSLNSLIVNDWKEKFVCVEEIKVFIDSKEDSSELEREAAVVVEREKQKQTDENLKKENNVIEKKEEGLLSRILPTSWKSMFTSNDDPSATLPLDIKNVNTSTTSVSLNNKVTKKKTCPFYKRVRDTRFVVDAFNYGKISECDGYFLTHYHSDHYGGLRASWSHGPIYCSQVTANLVKQELGVNQRYIQPLPMNELYPITSNITIALIDANHCPGSVLFLFIVQHSDGTKSRHLHTGDFRASPRMCLHPLIRQPDNGPIHCLYLDTTYLNPQYAFPAQEECIKAVCDLVKEELKLVNQPAVPKKSSLLENWVIQEKKKPMTSDNPMIQKDAFKLMMNPNRSSGSRVLIVVGTYTIGKERVFFNIAKMLNCKIYAQPKKKRILKCQQDKELDAMLTNDPMEAQVHVVSLRDIRGDIMSKYLDDHKSCFDSLIAFKPTGWTYKSSQVQTSDMKLAPLSHIIIPPTDRSLSLTPYYKNAKMKFYGVPYSEHSSFRELASFIASLDIQHIIPTVNMSKVQEMSTYFNKWQEEKLSKRIEVVAYPTEDHW